MTVALRLAEPTAGHPLAGHPLSVAIEAQLPLDTWDLRSFGYDRASAHARFRGRADRAGRGATDISQPWLLSLAKEWVLRGALRRLSAGYLDDVVLAIALLSATLRERADAGCDATRLGRDDLTAHLIRLGQLRETALLSRSGQQRCVRFLNRVLEDIRRWGLTDAGGVAAGLPDSFALTRRDQPRGSVRGVDEPSNALPREVVRQLMAPASLGLLESGSGRWAVNWFKLALGTGRRPGELNRLPLEGCLDYNVLRDEHGEERAHAVLIHGMSKVGLTSYRLPIDSETAAVIEDQRHQVLAAYPDADRARLPLFPHPHHNDSGLRPVATYQVEVSLRRWVEALPELRGPQMDEDGRATGTEELPDGDRPFPRQKVYPYALRHTWAQDHADAGTPLEVLQDLLGHAKPGTTQGYYRMTQARRHEAVSRLSRLQLTSTGSLVVAGLRALEREEDLRGQVGAVAVPFGTCVEPSNVKAGGHSCPYRMRCLGCSHFRTDPSYLPELGEYLTQLLVSRERLLSADSALEPWARDSALPSTEEIDRVRHLIHRCEDELEALTEDERAEITTFIAQVRTARAGTTQAVPLELLGIVHTDEPTLFAGSFQRLRSAGQTPPTGKVR
ncbi:MAG: tyrosine-type recombinase/integrase [Corynebacterium sp.]|uniref:tyrosine-type recombinase/integrase n=1 Tax=Corynebacterium sp. TaxID=1720 RepID=UPI003F8F3E52